MKQQNVIEKLSIYGMLSPDAKKELMDNVKREIGVGVYISGVAYALILNFDSEKNLTEVKLTPELDRDDPSFSINARIMNGYSIRTEAFCYLITAAHDIVLKHKLSISSDENRLYKYYFKNKEYTLYLDGSINYEFGWEAVSRDGKYYVSAKQVGYGEYTYQLYLNKGLMPSASTGIYEATFINLIDLLTHVKYLYEEAKTDVNSSGDTNFLEETLEYLEYLKVSTDDVICVVYGDVYMSWDVFAKNADFRYDSGFGNVEISDKIFIYTRDYIMYRHEYDGAEEWRAISTLESVISNKTQIHNDTEVDFRAD
jgi:hypothetical protein